MCNIPKVFPGPVCDKISSPAVRDLMGNNLEDQLKNFKSTFDWQKQFSIILSAKNKLVTCLVDQENHLYWQMPR